jgi:hypothetical protein
MSHAVEASTSEGGKVYVQALGDNGARILHLEHPSRNLGFVLTRDEAGRVAELLTAGGPSPDPENEPPALASP